MRLAVLLSLVAPLSVLIACSEPEAPPAPPAEPIPTPAQMLGGVDLTQPFRAVGTEPFWAVEVRSDGLVYSGADRPEQRAPNPGPVIQGTTAVYASATPTGTALVLTLMDTDCSDGMSDRTYPLTARVEIAGETLNGCAASVAFLMGTDEQGNPRAASVPAQ